MIRREDAPRPAGQQLRFGFATPCLHRRTTLRWRLARNEALHLELRCASCRRFLGWIRQDEWALALAPPRPRR
jgi:hypothetical protein